MPLEDYVFRLGASGIELNTDVSLPFVDILRVYGFDSAPIRETERDHEGVDGGFLDAEFETGRPIMMDGEVYATADELEVFLDSLKENWAPRADLEPLFFQAPGVQERLMFIKPRGVRYDWASERRRGIERIQFVGYAEDPRIYDANLLSTVIDYGGAAGNGFSFTFSFSFDFGGGAQPAGVFVQNNGNRPTPAILTIDGPITDPLIANDTTGSILQFKGIELGAGSDLVIDLAAKTVLLNGVTNRRGSLIDPNWFLLVPGSNFIRFGGTNGTGSTLTVQFRNAWR